MRKKGKYTWSYYKKELNSDDDRLQTTKISVTEYLYDYIFQNKKIWYWHKNNYFDTCQADRRQNYIFTHIHITFYILWREFSRKRYTTRKKWINLIGSEHLYHRHYVFSWHSFAPFVIIAFDDIDTAGSGIFFDDVKIDVGNWCVILFTCFWDVCSLYRIW